MTADQDFWTSLYGVRMPRIIYGTAWKQERTADLVGQALTLGFRGIDTACQPKHYDEAGVGAGLRAAPVDRADIYVQTKFTPLAGQDPQRVPYDPSAPSARQVAQSFERSQANLGTMVVDGLVLHSPLADPMEMREVWQAMESLFDQGGARQLGISNCYNLAQLRHLFEAARIKPAVLQNRFYAKTGYDRAIRDFCRQQGIIYQTFWTLTANPDILAHATVAALAAKHRRTAPQILFRYLSQLGHVPLTGTTSPDHMRQDLAIGEFALADRDCTDLKHLLGGGL